MASIEPVKVKVNGPRHRLDEIEETLKLHYIVVRTSKVIEHREDDLCHLYLSIFGRHR